MSHEVFKSILLANPLYENSKRYRLLVDKVYPQIRDVIFSIDKPYKNLGFPSENATTAYFSCNMSKDDLALVKEFTEHQNISLLNTRAFKKSSHHYIISVGSIQTKKS